MLQPSVYINYFVHGMGTVILPQNTKSLQDSGCIPAAMEILTESTGLGLGWQVDFLVYLPFSLFFIISL